MKKIVQLGCIACVCLANACTAEVDETSIQDHDSDAQLEIQEAVFGIKTDIESANIPGLQGIHLNSAKFSKFGPRNFERQDVTSTNQSEAAFFGSISDASYEIRDLKIDVFGDVGIATYYPEVSFIRDGEKIESSGRQTLVFLRADSGWKVVHEHGTGRE